MELLIVIVFPVCMIAIAWGIGKIDITLRALAEMHKHTHNEHLKAMQGIYDVLEKIEKKLPPR